MDSWSSEVNPGGNLAMDDVPRFQLLTRLGQGHFGEVWKGVRSSSDGIIPPDPLPHFVLKRLMVEHGDRVRLSGYRESYFGELIKKHQQAFDAGVLEPGSDKQSIAGLEHLVRMREGRLSK